MSDITQINNWFDAELVSVTDMQYANALNMQTIFGSMKVGKVLGIVPTISGSLFSVTSGFAFFGTTTDPTYIANTGSTTLFATVAAQGSLTLVNPNCYIYVRPVIATVMSNRYTRVTGVAYSSTNPSDVGIKICDVVAGVPINFNNNNIGDYFSEMNNIITLNNPDSSGLNLNVIGEGSFLNNSTGATIQLVRQTNTLPGKFMTFTAEDNNVSIPGGVSHAAFIKLDGGTSGPALSAAYSGAGNRWFQIDAAPGDMDPTVYVTALAMLGDIAYGLPSSARVLGGDLSIRIMGCNVFPSVNSGMTISGARSAFSYDPGPHTATYTLVGAGIITSARGYGSIGPANYLGTVQGLRCNASFDGINIILSIENTTNVAIVAQVEFSIVI